MNAVPGRESNRPGHIRLAGIVVLVVLTGFAALGSRWTTRLQESWFDLYQTALPREVSSLPVIIVEIDQKSLAARGRWPWPRTVLAELVDSIRETGPAVIGIDILMPEPDALSPESLLAHAGNAEAALAAALRNQPSNDEVLARALTAARAVLVVAGIAEPSVRPLRATRVSVLDTSAPSQAGKPIAPAVKHFAGALTSIDKLDAAAAGRGLISVDPEGGVVRRVPLIASIGGTLVPALAVELLRVAIDASSLRILATGSAVNGIVIGDHVVPTAGDGTARIYYSPRDARRFVSANDVLERAVPPTLLQQKVVVIGLTGLGLLDLQNTPSGELVPGSEIHAQLVENIYDRTLLSRPPWGRAVEVASLLLLGALLVWAAPRAKAQHAVLLVIACVLIPAGIGFALFKTQRLLLDAATPALCLLLLSGVLLVLTLADATRQKRLLQRVVQTEREQSARMAGELEAARRIQMATLPRSDSLRADRRIDIAALMIPARETGGDLYDFFSLDERRLFFIVGDVAGKGLSASIFMTVSKALYKSATLRTSGEDVGKLMTIADREVSRDNPEMLFVTAFAGVLDLDTGILAYCNAGHENPYVFESGDDTVQRIQDGDGPPLCAVDGCRYREGRRQLKPGEALCILTDGASEAQNRDGSLFGNWRIERTLRKLPAGATAQSVVDSLRADIEAFASGAEAADDLTIVVLRWLGNR